MKRKWREWWGMVCGARTWVGKLREWVGVAREMEGGLAGRSELLYWAVCAFVVAGACPVRRQGSGAALALRLSARRLSAWRLAGGLCGVGVCAGHVCLCACGVGFRDGRGRSAAHQERPEMVRGRGLGAYFVRLKRVRCGVPSPAKERGFVVSLGPRWRGRGAMGAGGGWA
jgi:hypothetical protein